MNSFQQVTLQIQQVEGLRSLPALRILNLAFNVVYSTQGLGEMSADYELAEVDLRGNSIGVSELDHLGMCQV